MSDLARWRSFKVWAFNVSIRKKIMGIAFGLLVLMGVGTILAVRVSLTSLLSDSSQAEPRMSVSVERGDRGGMPEEDRAHVLTTVTRHISMVIVVIALVGVVAASVLTNLIMRPIRELINITQAVGQGNFQQKTHLQMHDEIGRLGLAFNTMIDRLQAAQLELHHKEQMRSQLLRKLISAQEEERQRIALELHDQIGQSLTTILLGLKVIETHATSKEIRTHVGECRSFVAQAFNEVHDLALNLRPSVLDDLGLPATLRRHIEDFTRQFGITVEYQVFGFAHRERLLPEVETTIYRIVQEMLRNVARHAGVDRAGLILRRDATHVQAAVKDAGIGFDVSAVMDAQGGRQLGLFGMQERASLLGGALTIKSRPGAGATVIVDIPLKLNGADKPDYPS